MNARQLQELLRRIEAGEATALRDLIDHWRPRLLRSVRGALGRLVSPPTDDAVLGALRHAAWVRRKQLAFASPADLLRQLRQLLRAHVQILLAQAAGPRQKSGAEQRQQILKIHRSLKKFTPGKQILIVKRVTRQSPGPTSETEGVTLPILRKLHDQALDDLQEHLRIHGPTAGAAGSTGQTSPRMGSIRITETRSRRKSGSESESRRRGVMKSKSTSRKWKISKPKQTKAAKTGKATKASTPAEGSAPAARKKAHKAPATRRSGGKGPDDMHVTLTAPATVAPASSFVLEAWLHLAAHRAEVLRRARELRQRPDLGVQSRGPFAVPRGAALRLRLDLPGFRVTDPVASTAWNGDIVNATFGIEVPRRLRPGLHAGSIALEINGVRASRIHFDLMVAAEPGRQRVLRAREDRHRNGFASYSSLDWKRVRQVLQGIRTARPDLQVFVDVLDLRAGQRWAEEIRLRIGDSDVFYLFWSRNAEASREVTKEWRTALKLKGLDFIAPVALEPPEVAPPPRALRQLHFDEPLLRLRGRRPPARRKK